MRYFGFLQLQMLLHQSSPTLKQIYFFLKRNVKGNQSINGRQVILFCSLEMHPKNPPFSNPLFLFFNILDDQPDLNVTFKVNHHRTVIVLLMLLLKILLIFQQYLIIYLHTMVVNFKMVWWPSKQYCAKPYQQFICLPGKKAGLQLY